MLSRPLVFPGAKPVLGSVRPGCAHQPEHGGGVNEADLMKRVRAGDAAAFERVVDLYWRRALLYARYLVGDRDSACDFAQEAFARLWRIKDEWQPTGSVRVWLLRTIRNLVVSEQRRRTVRQRWALSAVREEAYQRTPLQDAERAELRAAMQHAIEQLSPRRREVFVLFHLQNLSYREIADLMEIRPQTVGNYLQAAVAELRVALAAFYPALSAEELPSWGIR